jgi:DNA-binding CsgD family transcriptional regulator
MRKLIPTVTPRELEVLALIAQGQTFQQIGDILGIATQTAKAHARSIRNKLRAKNRSHAIMLAMRRGLILEC